MVEFIDQKAVEALSTALSDRFGDRVLLSPDTRGVKYENKPYRIHHKRNPQKLGDLSSIEETLKKLQSPVLKEVITESGHLRYTV